MSGISTTNRVALDKAVTVASVNGPEVTIILGQKAAAGEDASNTVRCAYLTNGAVLSGFTLTNGGTIYYGGGVYCQSVSVVVSNCVLTGNSTSFHGGGAYSGTLNNCTLTGNSASCSISGSGSGYSYGGGAYSSILNNCTLTGNSASCSTYGSGSGHSYGGGAYGGTLNNCTLTGNSASYAGSGSGNCSGGGAHGGRLNNCMLTGNSASCSISGSGLSSGSGFSYGGGAYSGTLNNCTLTANSAFCSNFGIGYGTSTSYGGGADSSTLNNCTLTGNSASYVGPSSANCSGGGAYSSTLNNCIVYYNIARSGSNYSGGVLNYCCTAPLPGSGAGNSNADPQLASASHLSAGSPCRGSGSTNYATGMDIDGEAWASPPSIGCDEYHADALTGPLAAAILADRTSTVPGFALSFAAQTWGRTSGTYWDFGDGMAISNRACATHAWAALGDYPVVLTAYNKDNSTGVSATTMVHVASQVIHYVYQNSTNPVAPYTSWPTAAANIQDAIDAVYCSPKALVLVSNGVYSSGGRVCSGYYSITMNRVYVNDSITVGSVNGPEVTIILGQKAVGGGNGDNAVRCVCLTNRSVLVGFTLTNGATLPSDHGGGVYCINASVVSNCVLTGNSASSGGGSYYGYLNNCTLIGNSALTDGGGAYGGVLKNSTLAGNSSYRGGGASSTSLANCTVVNNLAWDFGGGVANSTLANCIVAYNTAWTDPNYTASTLGYCCTSPFPTGGLGNIAVPPLFVDYVGGNLYLQPNSPCINSGLNSYASGLTDLDGNPRIVGGTVDIGAYECQSPALLDYYLWLQSYGLPTGTSSLYADYDHDGLNNWQEWQCQTVPTNALSALRMVAATPAGTNVIVTWQSVAGVRYFLERGTNVAAYPKLWLLATNIFSQGGTTSYADTNAPSLSPLFYRVGVRPL